jgi:hypothetical protein
MTQNSALRVFRIDGVDRTDTTFRTAIVEHFVAPAGKSFVDLGAADGYEGRAIAARGASRVVGVEGKESLYLQAEAAAREAGLPNHSILRADVRAIDPTQTGGTFDCAMCFGLLYHMSNPYNLLKRIAHLTDDLLLLETHIAPDPSRDGRLLAKHHDALLPGLRRVKLDGEDFDGRICPHVGPHAVSKGSLDAEWSLWLSAGDLAKALTRAGFNIVHWIEEVDAATPPAVAKFGAMVGFGHANTKVFVVARVDRARRIAFDAPSLNLEGGADALRPEGKIRRRLRRLVRAAGL